MRKSCRNYKNRIELNCWIVVLFLYMVEKGLIMRKTLLKVTSLAMSILLLVSLCSCRSTFNTQKYSSSFFDCFDTVITVYGYAENQAVFNEFTALVHEQFVLLHEQFDAYHEYKGINNVYTVNQKAGVEPVKVSAELFDLIKRSKEMYTQTGGKVNIALGAVLDVWSTYRELATKDPDNAVLPDTKELGMAAQHIDINQIVLDEQAQTVFLSDPYMSLDVGAVAKGYACEIVKNHLMAKKYDSFVISAGGNVVAVGQDIGQESDWSIGIQNPDAQTAGEIIDTVLASDKAVVTAGSYQRYFTVNGVRYHHIIDPATLMPTAHFDSVTVICDDSMMADYMATTLFILPAEQAMALAEKIRGLEAVWVDTQGAITYTSGYPDYSKTY